MADDRKSGKPYKLPAIGRGSSRERLSRDEFDNMVRNMGARLARDYMRDEGAVRPRSSMVVSESQRLNSVPESPNISERNKAIRRNSEETVSRATGMKKGGAAKMSASLKKAMEKKKMMRGGKAKK